MKPLSERERRFVEAYMGEAAGNGTEACRLAGYKGNPKVLGVQSARLLGKASVQAAISQRQASDPFVWTREERQRFWTAVARGDAPYGEAKLKDRLRASELLGKAGADFVERHEHSGKDGRPLLPAGAVFQFVVNQQAEAENRT